MPNMTGSYFNFPIRIKFFMIYFEVNNPLIFISA